MGFLLESSNQEAQHEWTDAFPSLDAKQKQQDSAAALVHETYVAKYSQRITLMKSLTPPSCPGAGAGAGDRSDRQEIKGAGRSYRTKVVTNSLGALRKLEQRRTIGAGQGLSPAGSTWRCLKHIESLQGLH